MGTHKNFSIITIAGEPFLKGKNHDGESFLFSVKALEHIRDFASNKNNGGSVIYRGGDHHVELSESFEEVVKYLEEISK